MRYNYCFSVWPDEKWGFPKSVFTLFRALNSRVEMEFTEQEFDQFRDEVNTVGLSLREIERVPYHQPEGIL